MDHTIRHFTAVLLGAAAVLASASSAGCTLVPTDPIHIKQMMAREIAHRLGINPQQFPLNAISPPQLHTPLPLGADCSGLGAFHHSAGFRWAQAWRPGPGRTPEPQGTGAPPKEPGRQPDRGPDFWPAQCAYEGVAVVLGYGYSSPVAVNFERRCE